MNMQPNNSMQGTALRAAADAGRSASRRAEQRREMRTLFDEAPEACAFCDEVIRDVERYRLDDREVFAELNPAVLSTSGVDMQGDAFARSGLDCMVAQMRDEPVWMGYNHDPLIPPIGRIVAAKVFYAPISEVYFVAGVVGRYKRDAYRALADLASVADVWRHHPTEPQPSGTLVRLACNPHEVEEVDIRGALDGAPDFVATKPELVFRKAADPLTVITMLLSGWVLTNNPFSKRFLERHGEAAADFSLELMRWLRERVWVMVSKLRAPRVLFELRAPYGSCSIDFVIDSKDPAVLSAAMDQLEHACDAALGLADHLQKERPIRIVYVWEVTAGRWVPHYANTANGVITDRPYLMAVEWKGLSVAGIATRYAERGAGAESAERPGRTQPSRRRRRKKTRRA